jgi:hypothetical protein
MHCCDDLHFLGLQSFHHGCPSLSDLEHLPSVSFYDQGRFAAGPPVLTSTKGTKRVALVTNSNTSEYDKETSGQHLINIHSCTGCKCRGSSGSHGEFVALIYGNALDATIPAHYICDRNITRTLLVVAGVCDN